MLKKTVQGAGLGRQAGSSLGRRPRCFQFLVSKGQTHKAARASQHQGDKEYKCIYYTYILNLCVCMPTNRSVCIYVCICKLGSACCIDPSERN